MSNISGLGQSVIMMGGGPTAKFFKGVSAELANLWKHKQILSKRFNLSFGVFTKKSGKYIRLKSLVFQKVLQANLDLNISIFPLINRVMFYLRKIYVLNLKTDRPKKNALCRWICKLRSFLNREFTVLIKYYNMRVHLL